VKRFAWLALAFVVAYTGAAAYDACAECESTRCPPACHIACADGCATAPVESAPPKLVALEPNRVRPAEIAAVPLDLTFPPDLFPPRG
jgi:hypothetical protein